MRIDSNAVPKKSLADALKEKEDEEKAKKKKGAAIGGEIVKTFSGMADAGSHRKDFGRNEVAAKLAAGINRG
jgi:hypothetical protein